MKKEIPILFSTPMVIAVDNETKSKTRRTRGLEKINIKATEIVKSNNWQKQGDFVARFVVPGEVERYEVTDVIKCPYGKIGDLLWVRETFAIGLTSGFHFFKANYVNREVPSGLSKWKPSIHMPKSYARIWLEITNIRVERLHDITEEDAKAEGVLLFPQDDDLKDIQVWDGNKWGNTKTINTYKNYLKNSVSECYTARDSFESLWYETNGVASWFANPWVWVIEFKKITR
ncbi:MAG: hypothetical protein A3F72_03040 [Bacteroidetes bacterium RIFCSPLOWO2_12_FULL_35_15]|nr:MAG: hypothetical protein A3F72_03040 [Bacteroidetes bacterium RIFCSPLOWO2_12_FULL_35_15]